MIRVCQICSRKFETMSSKRIYCYKCSGESIRSNYKTRKHQKNNIKKKFTTRDAYLHILMKTNYLS